MFALLFATSVAYLPLAQAAVGAAVGSRARLSCSDSYASILSSVTRVQIGEMTIFAGYRQASANNKDPVFARFDETVQTWCHDDLETTGDDQEAYGLLVDTTDDVIYGFVTCTG